MGDDVLDVNDQCHYDELPKSMPETESGYDLAYTLPIPILQRQKLDILAPEDSILKVLIISKNPRDNINAFLYDSQGNLIANSLPDFTYKTLTASLKGQKKAYKLKIVYDTFDDDEVCPYFHLRMALKPVHVILDDGLNQCQDDISNLPQLIKVTQESLNNIEDGGFVHTEVHSVPLKSISQANAKDLTVTMELDLPQLDNEKLYYVDVETLFGFLVSEMADISLY